MNNMIYSHVVPVAIAMSSRPDSIFVSVSRLCHLCCEWHCVARVLQHKCFQIIAMCIWQISHEVQRSPVEILGWNTWLSDLVACRLTLILENLLTKCITGLAGPEVFMSS